MHVSSQHLVPTVTTLTRTATNVLAMTTSAPRLAHDAHRRLGVLRTHPLPRRLGGQPRYHRPGHHRGADRRPRPRGNRVGVGHPERRRRGRRGLLRPRRTGARGRAEGRPDPRRLWTGPRTPDAGGTAAAPALVGESGVAVLETSVLLGGGVDDPACTPELDAIFAAARQPAWRCTCTSSPGAASDIDQVRQAGSTPTPAGPSAPTSAAWPARSGGTASVPTGSSSPPAGAGATPRPCPAPT